MLVGDSFAVGVGVPKAEPFAGRLQTALKPRGAEALNAGVGSHTPPLERIKARYLYEREGLRYV